MGPKTLFDFQKFVKSVSVDHPMLDKVEGAMGFAGYPYHKSSFHTKDVSPDGEDSLDVVFTFEVWDKEDEARGSLYLLYRTEDRILLEVTSSWNLKQSDKFHFNFRSEDAEWRKLLEEFRTGESDRFGKISLSE